MAPSWPLLCLPHLFRTAATLFLVVIVVAAPAQHQGHGHPAESPLPQLRADQLRSDLDLLVSALKEGHAGLYRYTDRTEFDALVHRQRALITGDMDVLAFYRIVAPIVAATKEDHCDIALPERVQQTLQAHGRYLPFTVALLHDSVYITNASQHQHLLRGSALLQVDGGPIDQVLQQLYSTYASDGNVISSKQRYLDNSGFAREYTEVIGAADSVTIAYRGVDGGTHALRLATVDRASLRRLVPEADPLGARREQEAPAHLHFIDSLHAAVLTFNTFSNSRYKEAGLDFPRFVRTAFDSIRTRECRSLIIDIRENGGGSEGNEDLLFAELNTGPYVKYRSVEASAFTFSFLRYTDLRRKADARELEIELRREHAAAPDGRLLRRPGVMEPAPPRSDAFTGQVCVLTSGWTYSGGAEFASLMRQHTGAIFIGEEVGGAFGGNTSGHMLTLTLPHSRITVEVPILSFNLAVDRQALDRGVLPDIALQPTIGQFLRGEDVVMERALGLAGALGR